VAWTNEDVLSWSMMAHLDQVPGVIEKFKLANISGEELININE